MLPLTTRRWCQTTKQDASATKLLCVRACPCEGRITALSPCPQIATGARRYASKPITVLHLSVTALRLHATAYPKRDSLSVLLKTSRLAQDLRKKGNPNGSQDDLR